jgi:hypothetical protein
LGASIRDKKDISQPGEGMKKSFMLYFAILPNLVPHGAGVRRFSWPSPSRFLIRKGVTGAYEWVADGSQQRRMESLYSGENGWKWIRKESIKK